MRTDDQKLDECKRVVAELLLHHGHVTVRYVMERAALSQSQVRRLLDELTSMGWLDKKRVSSVGNGYFPTDIGRFGFSSCLPTGSLSRGPVQDE